MEINAKNDHDLLIELSVQVVGIREDIKKLSDGTIKVQDDHELRIRALEKDKDTHNGRIAGISAVISLIIVVAGALIQAFVK